MGQIPDKPTLDGIETRWSERWEADGTYRFDRTAERADVFSVDTPPPTVSGSIHMGTVFGYTQTDAIARHLPNAELRTALVTLIDEAQGDVEKARQNIEAWYDAMMDRVAGWYKRRTAVLMLGLGIAIAAVLNADTINIANALARDGALRSSMVSAAISACASSRRPSCQVLR